MMTVERTRPRRVDFHLHAQDYQVILLASMGLYTEKICDITGLTAAQVSYRLWVYERKERERNPGSSARKQYRAGESPVSKLLIQQAIRGRGGVKKLVESSLDRRGLYKPRAKGVLKDRE